MFDELTLFNFTYWYGVFVGLVSYFLVSKFYSRKADHKEIAKLKENIKALEKQNGVLANDIQNLKKENKSLCDFHYRICCAVRLHNDLQTNTD